MYVSNTFQQRFILGVNFKSNEAFAMSLRKYKAARC